MKVAIIFNRDSERVVNLLGLRNQEKYRVEAIKRIVKALKDGGHHVKSFEGDKDIIARLEDFMPSVVKGERPGMVFNLAYGIQGQARYTHVPGILEMIGMPYVGSGPLAHSLSLDKVVAKTLWSQAGLPTPAFAVLEGSAFESVDLEYPLIVKPKNESDSFGLKVVHSEAELREAAEHIFDRFQQPVLAEQYIDGREINVGLLGNPPEAFMPVELDFGDGPRIYSNDDKGGRSGRTVPYVCPAPLPERISERARDLAVKAFKALGCFDCARVDMRLDDDGNVYLLELNSLPSLGYRGSYVAGAAHAGLDFTGLVNRLVDIACARYFGMPSPAPVTGAALPPQDEALRFLTERRDRLERRVAELVGLRGRTPDPVGIRECVRVVEKRFADLGLKPVEELSDEHVVRTWQTRRGFEGGTLLIAQLDVPLGVEAPYQAFRRDAEWLHGEGVGSSRAPLAILEFALRAMRHVKRLQRAPVGVLLYSDEGRDCRYSAKRIAEASAKAKRVLVLRPGSLTGKVIGRRRGLRKYSLVIEGKPRRLGQKAKLQPLMRWAWNRLEAICGLQSRRDRIEIHVVDVHTTRFPTLVPHRLELTVLLTYPKSKVADAIESQMRALLGRDGHGWKLHLVSDRPPMGERKQKSGLLGDLQAAAEALEVPLGVETSAAPSPAGLVPGHVDVICGYGPVVRDLHTPHEAVQRISLMRYALLLARYLTAANGASSSPEDSEPKSS